MARLTRRRALQSLFAGGAAVSLGEAGIAAARRYVPGTGHARFRNLTYIAA